MTLTATRPAPTTEQPARPTEPAAAARAVIATDRAGVIRHLTPEIEELLGKFTQALDETADALGRR